MTYLQLTVIINHIKLMGQISDFLSADYYTIFNKLTNKIKKFFKLFYIYIKVDKITTITASALSTKRKL